MSINASSRALENARAESCLSLNAIKASLILCALVTLIGLAVLRNSPLVGGLMAGIGGIAGCVGCNQMLKILTHVVQKVTPKQANEVDPSEEAAHHRRELHQAFLKALEDDVPQPNSAEFVEQSDPLGLDQEKERLQKNKGLRIPHKLKQSTK